MCGPSPTPAPLTVTSCGYCGRRITMKSCVYVHVYVSVSVCVRAPYVHVCACTSTCTCACLLTHMEVCGHVNRWQTFERGREWRARRAYQVELLLLGQTLNGEACPESCLSGRTRTRPGLGHLRPESTSSEDMYTMAMGMHVGHIAACLGRARNDMRNDKWRRGWV